MSLNTTITTTTTTTTTITTTRFIMTCNLYSSYLTPYYSGICLCILLFLLLFLLQAMSVSDTSNENSSQELDPIRSTPYATSHSHSHSPPHPHDIIIIIIIHARSSIFYAVQPPPCTLPPTFHLIFLALCTISLLFRPLSFPINPSIHQSILLSPSQLPRNYSSPFRPSTPEPWPLSAGIAGN